MSKLCSEPRLQKVLQNYAEYIRDDSMTLGNRPRYEDYSLRARKLPFFVYDNPAFTKQYDTAFTDFRSVYINKNFLLGLMKCDEVAKALGLPAHHVVFVLLHEVAHCLNEDKARLGLLPGKIANVAQDIANNLVLKFGFEQQLGVYPEIMKKVLGFSGYGLSKKELSKYGKMSSETIGIEMYRAIVEKLKNNPLRANSSNSPMKEPPQKEQPTIDPLDIDDIDLNTVMDSTGNRDPLQDFIDSYDPTAPDESKHTVSPQEIADMAMEGGLPQSTIDALGINPPRTQADIEAIEELNKLASRQAAQEMQGIWDKMTTAERGETLAGMTPGYYEEKVDLDGVGKITWKAALKEATTESGMGNEVFIEDEIIDDYYVNSMLFDGSYVPMEKERGILLSLIDTSGSMAKHFIMSGLNESIASVDNDGMGGGVSECIVFPADVDVKGKYWTLTEANKNQVCDELRLIGGGGTDFTLPIKNALLQAEQDNKDVSAVLLVTDLGAPAPEFDIIESAIEKPLPPIIFVTDSDNKEHRNRFEKACEGKAVVYFYEDGLVADIEEIQNSLNEIQSATNVIENNAQHDAGIGHQM